MVEPIRRSRLSQQIVAQICQLIRQGRFRPGDRLPPERELSEQLQVSRASLREVLRELEISGIVEARHGGGTYVRDFSELEVISPLALVLEASGDIVGDLWEARVIFEPSIAALAAVRATAIDIEALDAIVERQAGEFEGAEGNDRAVSLDREFHSTIARASGNEVALRVLHLINQLLHEGQRHFITSSERRGRAYLCHREILSAIRDGEPHTARTAMLRHLQEVEAFILGEVIGDAQYPRVRD
jgi:GntR family transcriptional regulator, transcriptional repressor for pyruvate dehydrogenase complex